MNAQTSTLAIVGGGPSSTYVLDRLAATVGAETGPIQLHIHIFDKSGQFGAGQVHSPDQPTTSFLNRIVGQVAFAADESVEDAGPLLSPADRPTLLDWCRNKFDETGDPVYDLQAEGWPKRYIHGEALRERFDRYVALLREHPGVEVELHHGEVIDLVDNDRTLGVVTADGGDTVEANHVLMITGHSSNDPLHYPSRRQWTSFAAKHRAVFVPSAYPLDAAFGAGVIDTSSVVGCLGMGLTSIDIILHLTEGRGGRFERPPDAELVYHPSGQEPKSIAVFSRSGLFTFARPYNAKEQDLGRLEHRGVFLTEDAVAQLRRVVGVPNRLGTRTALQLDFRKQVLPLVVLEMAHLYYRTLYGENFGEYLAQVAEGEYRAFLADGGAGASSDEAITRVLGPLERAVDDAATRIDEVLTGASTLGALSDVSWDARAGLNRYLEVVFGPSRAQKLTAAIDTDAFAADVARAESPYRHPTRASDNRFSWEKAIEPLPRTRYSSGRHYRDALLNFIDIDHRWAAQNNLDNPAKAAADGVWRDLRDVLAFVLDFGGLQADSHRDFLDVFMRHHNRLCNGAALEVMEKVRVLIEQGIVDVSAGPDAYVRTDEETGHFHVVGPLTGTDTEIDVLVDSRVHPFAAEHDILPLYPNLLRRGLVRTWTNPGLQGHSDFAPGGLDLTEDFHPVRADGAPDRRLTLLGPPSEGVMFFQLGALRPNQNHHVMQDVLRWLREFWSSARRAAAHQLV
ncbi:FAD/NAD(P)-binding protein [Gordonia sp. ABSL11-1]|uniref:FAD/NAD(P)-binding protein n=1 Tax=Gordonia sp. ABSL11-1 TaxID=3053924 RepID=UPI0025739ABF|nr:FAD/NAD(P)-binding protein [Gordonia sp. ABSL11-1]MDL9947216.1 FAD/NAD(P)-binding protein [Gordonia sp. ABSL11-1]